MKKTFEMETKFYQPFMSRFFTMQTEYDIVQILFVKPFFVEWEAHGFEYVFRQVLESFVMLFSKSYIQQSMDKGDDGISGIFIDDIERLCEYIKTQPVTDSITMLRSLQVFDLILTDYCLAIERGILDIFGDPNHPNHRQITKRLTYIDTKRIDFGFYIACVEYGCPWDNIYL
tara:strand:+ start:479 stop:997 length:519 start_codon:yes stop_codon:yes gene_type:complete